MITLTGNPLSTQHCYGFSRYGGHMKRHCATLKTDYQWQAKSQWNDPVTKEEVRIEAHIYFGDKRRRDLDNYNKLWMDALEGVVYEDDSQITQLHLVKDYDKSNPRIEITII